MRRVQSPRSFHRRVVEVIRKIPYGQVATYGQIAACAGSSRAARQVAYILHASSEKEGLPWHRVVNGQGGISLRRKHGYELQKQLLEEEGVIFGDNDLIDLRDFGWIYDRGKRG